MVGTPVRLAALLGAVAVSLAWLWRGTGVAAPAPGAAATSTVATGAFSAPVVAVPAITPALTPAPAAATVAAPPPVPYAYVGSWRAGGRLHLLLKRGASTFSVAGLGAVDDQYVVAAADEDQVSLRYLPLGTLQVIRREKPPAAPTEMARTPSARSDGEAQSEEN